MADTYYSSFASDDILFNHLCRTSNGAFNLHNHDICELLFLKRGKISYMVEGRIYQLSPNSLILTRPSQQHSITPQEGIEYERYNILFDEKKLHSDVYCRIPSSIDVINFDNTLHVCSLFDKIDYYAANFEGEALKLLLMHLTEELLYNILLASKSIVQKDMHTGNPLINKAMKYIDDNITEQLSIDMICDELYITKSHLHHLFMKHLQITPKKYIVSKKLVLAQRDIRAGRKPSEVFYSCGFADYSTFYRDYKKHFGYPPSDESSNKIVRKIQS